MNNLSPRVAVYGMGFVGNQLAGFVLDKGWELVGAYNRAGEKVGQDVGTLLGREPAGVIVEDCEKADFSSLKADVGFVAMTDWLEDNFVAYERFMQAGANVLCHGSEANHPRRANPVMAAKIDEMARQNGVTFTGGGIWDMTRIWAGIMVAGPNTELESMHHISQTDTGRQGVHHLRRVGGGMTVEEFEEKVGAHHKNVSGIPKIIPLTVVDGLGFDVKEVKEWLEPVVFEEDYYSRWLEQEMPAGIVAGVRMLVDIVTEQGPTIHARIEHRDFREGEEETIEWKVKGKPSMEIRVLRKDSHMASASSLFNRIPDVMEGDPGIVELWKYRPLRPSIFY